MPRLPARTGEARLAPTGLQGGGQVADRDRSPVAVAAAAPSLPLSGSGVP